LRAHELPDFIGGVFATIKASSDDAYRRLIAKAIDFYAEALFDPQWGEQIRIGHGYVAISMVFQGLDKPQAEAVWKPFFDWVAASPQDFAVTSAPLIVAVPARHFWDPAFLKQAPGVVIADDRPNAPADNVFWAGNLEETGAVWYAYQSAWLPQSLLQDNQRQRLADALFAAAKHRGVSLHFNKGLAGATEEAISSARDTAMNPAVVDAFALAISGALGQPAYPDVPGHEPDETAAHGQAAEVNASMSEIRKLLPRVGSYVWETDYFQPHWQEAFWGDNYDRLLAVKTKYDPGGLFFLHHGVGSEDWSADGFTRLN
jgi:FAD/FMN-containing dehydrogenase